MNTSSTNEKEKSFYITTTLPYINSDPHIGFALEIVQADIIARYKRASGYDVFFNTGTDEHGLKIHRKALEQGIEVQTYADDYALRFKGLKEVLGLSDLNFIRTTDEHHKKAAQKFWKLCDERGFMYKKSYKIRYCVGCELEKTDSELVEDHCPIHPNLGLEIIEEENYFFKFSQFQKQLLDLYALRPDFVLPVSRCNEIKAFVLRGLEDFSVSRLASKMPWGVPVPGDDTQVMYVWFDALVNYVSAIGWPDDIKTFEKYWPVIQYAGKDNLRQQSAMWQAMLLAAGLSPSQQIIIHGFVTHGGQKMSKSLGNVLNPYDIVHEYGTDALRYYLAREIHPFEDSDFTMERFKESYNANLANGIGNLTSRIMKMVTAHGVTLSSGEKEAFYFGPGFVVDNLEQFNCAAYADEVWSDIQSLDEHIQRTEPFKKIKENPEEAKKDLHTILVRLHLIARKLEPILPDTSAHIIEYIFENKMPEVPLFARKD